MSQWQQIIRNRMSDLRITQQQLAVYSGVATGSLSQFLSSEKDLGGAGIQKLDAALRDLARLRDAALPFPIDFRQIRVINDLLDRLRDDGDVTFKSQRAEQEPAATPVH